MKAAILIIGDEILLGRVVDTNSGFIARTLDPMGIQIACIRTVGDDAESITTAVNELTKAYPLVLTTGGLGPTKDDITKTVMCNIFGGHLEYSAEVMEDVQAHFVRRGLSMNHLTETQAMVPTSCRVIRNKLGTAPILWFENKQGHVLITLPGVPHETEGMMRKAVVGEIAKHFSPDTHYVHRTMLTAGMSESGLAERLAPWEEQLPAGFHLAYLPDAPVIKLRLDGSGTDEKATEQLADKLFVELQQQTADIVFALEEITPAAALIDALRVRRLMFSTAESCTGGNIAHRITETPGSSDVFCGGVVSYSNAVKHKVLGLEMDTLDKYGAVSEQTVRQMLEGVCRVMDSDCAVATSGIAGPGGGTPDKPVGTVWIGAKWPGGARVELFHLRGSRSRIIEQATTRAMLMLLQELNKTAKAD